MIPKRCPGHETSHGQQTASRSNLQVGTWCVLQHEEPTDQSALGVVAADAFPDLKCDAVLRDIWLAKQVVVNPP